MQIDLEDRLPSWVRHGLVDAEQAERILDHERAAGTAASTAAAGDGRTLLAEVVGYLGAVLTVVAAGLVLGEFWEQLTRWGRVTLAVLLTVAVLLAGLVLRGRDHPAVQRLVGVLWFAAIVGVATTTVLAVELAEVAERTTALIAAGTTTAAAAVLHRLRQGALQLIALALSTLALAVAALTFPHASVDQLWIGLVVWSLGVAAVLLGFGGWLAPARTAVVVGLLAIGVGCQAAALGAHEEVGIILALSSAGVLLWAAAALGDTVLLGFAVAGVFVFAPQAVFTFFADSIGAPLALLLTGLVLVAAAVGLVVVRRQIDADDAGDGT